MAPANTGNESNNRNEVINTDHTNKGILCMVIPGALILKMVVIKLIAPKIEAAPDKCKLKIAKSTDGPECAWTLLNGGYTVQPVPAPASTKVEDTNKINDGGRSQKEILFIRGKAISGAPIISGTKKLPKPPIRTGITIKKIIKNAWPVIKTLYNWWLPNKIWLPGWASSIRIKIDIVVPKIPDKPPKIKYRIPISLWFVEKSQRLANVYICENDINNKEKSCR